MENIFDAIFSQSFGYSIIRVTTPILFATMGALISNKAGVVNISLEGTMLSSALAGVLVSAFTDNLLAGLLAGLLVGILLSLLLAYFHLNLKTNIFLTGIAINLLSSGATVFLLYIFARDKGISANLASKVFPNVAIPFLTDIPVLGPIFSGHNILTYVGIFSVVFMYFFLYRTPMGLKIRAVGEYSKAAESVGINVTKVQYSALALSGVFAALGGMFMSMGYVSWFSRDMMSGRGFIGLAAESMGKGTPLGSMIAAIVFGFADALSNSLQTMGLPVEIILVIPYLTTIIGLVIYSISKHKEAH